MDDPTPLKSTTDFVQYFKSYESLYQQKSMLEDTVRMDAYYSAIRRNGDMFKDKVRVRVRYTQTVYA